DLAPLARAQARGGNGRLRAVLHPGDRENAAVLGARLGVPDELRLSQPARGDPQDRPLLRRGSVGALPGAPRALALGVHLLLEAGLVDREPLLRRDVARQV